MALKLIIADKHHEEAWKDFLREYNACNAKMRWDMHMNFSIDEYELYLKADEDIRNGINLREGYGIRTSYFMVDSQKDDYFIGSISVRHELTREIADVGGHIGYSIRPSERGKGYATKQLEMALEICRGLGIYKVLLTCNNDNSASAAVIKKCGGIFEKPFKEDNGNIVDRYWISL